MWIGAYEQEGRTDFFAITSDKVALGPFRRFEDAKVSLTAHEEKLNSGAGTRFMPLIPVHVHRQTRLGKNRFEAWIIADIASGFLIFLYSDESAVDAYLVISEQSFALVGSFPDLITAESAASNASEYRI